MKLLFVVNFFHFFQHLRHIYYEPIQVTDFKSERTITCTPFTTSQQTYYTIETYNIFYRGDL